MKYKGISIIKRKNCNTWSARFRRNGKQHYISARTKKECLDKLKSAYADLQYGINKVTKTITLENWYNRWLELYKINKVKETTLLDYRQILKNISPNLLQKKIEQIQIEDILETLNNIKSSRMKQKAYDLLNMIFNKAEENDIIEKNIFYKIEKPKHTKDHGIALTHEQTTTLDKVCRNIKYGDIFLTCLYQGFRRGECLALTIDDIDYDNNTITINKAINHNNKLDTTKNKQSIRTVPMFKNTKNILLKYKESKKGSRIFNVTYNWLDIVKSKIIQQTKFDFDIKDLRSTFITRCKELNIPEHIIQSWVGHMIGSKVTSQVYTKHNSDADIKYIDILNNSD